MSGGEANRRAHFRLPYPPGAGPLLVIGERQLAVTELSEGGLKFDRGEFAIAAREHVDGTLRFAGGDELPVKGVVSRLEGPLAVVRLKDGVSLERMLAEQRRILRAFPDFLFS